MAVRTKPELLVQIATLLADSTNGDITAEDVRSVCNDLTDSLAEDAALSPVAKTGAYGDLTGAPSIPSTPGDIGAATAAQGALAATAIQQVAGATSIEVITQAAFDALDPKVADRLYLING